MNACPAVEEAACDRALLGVLLALHPIQLTLAELGRELGGPAAEIEDSVRRLAAGGLVHRHGEFVIPTRAADLSRRAVRAARLIRR